MSYIDKRGYKFTWLFFPYLAIQEVRSKLCNYRTSLRGGEISHPGAYLLRHLLLSVDSFLLMIASLYACLLIVRDLIRIFYIGRIQKCVRLSLQAVQIRLNRL
jgi:hypothetical protein